MVSWKEPLISFCRNQQECLEKEKLLFLCAFVREQAKKTFNTFSSLKA